MVTLEYLFHPERRANGKKLHQLIVAEEMQGKRVKNYSAEDVRYLLDQLDRIVNAEVKQAFLYLITDAKLRPDYDVRPGTHGYIPDFRYYREGKWCYAFIPNQNSLLWYFRRPLLGQVTVDLAELKINFEEVNVTTSDEISVRINNYDDAVRITGFLH